MNQILADSARPAAEAGNTLVWSSLAPDASGHPVTADPRPSSGSDPSLSRSLVARQIEALGHRRMQEVEPRLESTLAHDLNNLLMSIVGNTDLAQRKLARGARPEEHLEQIRAAVERARQLLSRSSGACRRPGGQKLKIELQRVVLEAAELVRATLPANVNLCLRIDDSAPALWIDEVQVHRLILNLARNAIQAMAAGGGELGIALEMPDPSEGDDPQSTRCLRLEVRDQGEGIAPGILKRILEPGFTTRPGSGSGWGLASVARIARDHGALLRVESFVGLGSRFHIFFPLE